MRILYSVSFYLPPPSSPQILIFPSDLNIPAEEEWWWKRLGRDHFVHFAKNSIWTISAIDGAPRPRINRDRTQQNGGNSPKIRILHSVVRSFPRFPRSNKFNLFDLFISFRRVERYSIFFNMEMFIVTSFENCRGNQKRFVLFCGSRTLNFRACSWRKRGGRSAGCTGSENHTGSILELDFC